MSDRASLARVKRALESKLEQLEARGLASEAKKRGKLRAKIRGLERQFRQPSLL